jgi:PAS domain S-box-containing protein
MISFEHLIDFLESSDSMFWSVDLESQTFEYVNIQKLEEIYQRPVSYFDQGLKAWVDVFHPEDQKNIAAIYDQMVNGLIQVHEGEHRIIRADHQVRWIRLHQKLLIEDQTHRKLVMGITTDITEMKTSETKLINLNSRLDKILEAGGLGSWDYYFQTGQIIYDERWGNMLGLDVTKFAQDITTWQNLVHPEDLDRALKLVNSYISGESDFYECIFRMRHVQGHWVWILAKAKYSQWNAQGEPTCLTGTHLDITTYKDNEFLLQQIQDMANIGGWEIDLKTEQTLMTDQVYKIYGYDEYIPVLLKDGLECYVGHEKVRMVNYLNGCRQGEPFQDVFEFVDTKGNHKWVESRGWPIYDADRNVRKIRGTFQDVTQMHRSKLELTSYIQGLDRYAIVALTDKDGTILSVNQAFIDICGYSENELIGQNHRIINSGYHDDKFFQEMWSTILDGKQWRGLIKNRAKCGREYWVDTTITPKFDVAGNIKEFLAFRYDVTKHKENELQLKNQLRLKDLVQRLELRNIDRENTDHIHADLLEELRSTDWLPHVVQVIYFKPYQRAQLMGSMKIIDLPSIGEFRLLDSLLMMTCSKGQSISGYFVIEFADQLQIDDLKNDDFTKSLSECLADIIARLDMKAELNDQKRIALHHAKLASIGQLAAGVGHEINNPLMIMDGYIDKLHSDLRDKGLTNPRYEEWFDRLHKSATRITNIVKGLSSFSRRDTDNKSIICLSDLVVECYQLVKEIYAKEQILIEIEVEDQITINANYGKMQQVIMNLISNAKDAVEDVDQKLIQVFLRTHNQQALIQVKDSGIGIPVENRDIIFDPFFTTKDVNKGTGLGLSLVYGLVQEHEGTIDFITSTLEGTVFNLRFPLAKEDPLPQEATLLKHQASDFRNLFQSKRRALVFDDDFQIRDLVRSVLVEFNFEVDEALDSSDSACEPYDLIISDTKMPNLSGQKLSLEPAGPDNKCAKFLFITEDRSIDENAPENLNILYKPFNSSQLERSLIEIFS